MSKNKKHIIVISILFCFMALIALWVIGYDINILLQYFNYENMAFSRYMEWFKIAFVAILLIIVVALPWLHYRKELKK